MAKRISTINKRRIAVITGTRAEYGILTSLMHAIDHHPKMDLQLIAGGMHLLPKFGKTINQIKRDGWDIAAKVPMQRGDDTNGDQAYGLGRGVIGISKYLEEAKTDIVVVLGDRIEAMAGAMAGFSTGRLVAQIHGGDVAEGDIDDSLRHSITKLTHIHLAATKDSAKRIQRLGEEPSRIHVVGALGLDDLFELVETRGGISEPGDRGLLIHHPRGQSAEAECKLMRSILKAMLAAKLPFDVIYPNSDRGHSGVIKAIEETDASTPDERMRVVKSLPREKYLQTLADARMLVGNSSSGIIEAGAVCVPVVNIGERQAGRLRNGKLVIDCNEKASDIKAAIAKVMTLRRPRKPSETYGTGNASNMIAKLLSSVPLTDTFRRKRITY